VGVNYCTAASRPYNASLPRAIRYPRSCLFHPSVTAGTFRPIFPIAPCLSLTFFPTREFTVHFSWLFKHRIHSLYTCLIRSQTSLISHTNRSAQIPHALSSHWTTWKSSWILLHSINIMLYPLKVFPPNMKMHAMKCSLLPHWCHAGTLVDNGDTQGQYGGLGQLLAVYEGMCVGCMCISVFWLRACERLHRELPNRVASSEDCEY
jgi:hypothetical protein